MLDFKNMAEVAGYNEETLVLDLLQHAMALDDEPYVKALVPADKGLYLLGSVEPLLRDSEKYYYQSQMSPDPLKPGIYNFDNALPIKDLGKVSKYPDDVVDVHGKVVLTARDIRSKGKYFRTEPTVPSTAIKMAITVVQRYLGTLCRHTSHIHTNYRMETLVKEEYSYLIDNDEYMHAFERLLDQVMHFVGKDTWNIYFCSIKGNSLIINKSLDWRIYRYYELTLTEQEQEEE